MSQELTAPAAAAAGAAAGVTEAVQMVRECVGLVLKPALTELGGMAGDTFAAWRFRNQVRIVQKTMKFLKERKIDPRKLQPTIAVPLLEAAADTDDENLSEMFSQLLTAHLDPSRQDEVHPSFAKVMAQLSPYDAKLLSIVDGMRHEEHLRFAGSNSFKPAIIKRDEILEEGVKQIPNTTAGELGLCLDNLERLGLLEGRENLSSSLGWAIPKYGQRFLVACNGPDYWRREMLLTFDRDDLRYEERQMNKKFSLDAYLEDESAK